MFSFFAFMFIGIAILFRLANEKAEDCIREKENKEIAEINERFNEITGTFESGTEGKRARLQIEFMLHRSDRYKDEIFEELHDDLVYIYGTDYKSVLFEEVRSPYMYIEELWLSRRGKIYLNNYWLHKKFELSPGEPGNHKFLKRIQYNLRNTAGNVPGCPDIAIVELENYPGNKSWGDRGVYYKFKHTVYSWEKYRHI